MKYFPLLKEHSWVLAAAICIAGFLFNYVAVFPGLMSPDSFYMYNQGVEWIFSDYHHPFISVLMGLGRFIRNDPSPYLFFQLLLFWGGTYIFTLALRNQVGKWAIIIPLISFLPFNLSLSGYLHKTPLLSTCFLFSFSWFFLSYSQNKKLSISQLIISIPIIFLGSVIRGYSYLAALPILGFMVWMFIKNKSNTLYNIASVTLVSFLFVILFAGLNQFLVYEVLNAKKTYKHQIIYRIDMAAIYALTGKVYAEEFLKDEFKEGVIAKKFYDEKMKTQIWTLYKIYKNVNNAEDVERMQVEWLRAISENFWIYSQHRMNVILKTFGINHKVSAYKGFNARHRYNVNNLEKYDSVYWDFFRNYIRSFNNVFFMKPWFWAVSNILFSTIGFILILMPHYRVPVLPHCILLWSGLLLLAPYLLICLSADTRFTYWITIATSFGGFGIIAILLTRFRSNSVNSHGAVSENDYIERFNC